MLRLLMGFIGVTCVIVAASLLIGGRVTLALGTILLAMAL